MLVCVCGNGYSGSSAVTDYLRDCDCVTTSIYDIEFYFITDVDGIDDLRHHLVERPVRFFSSDAAIKRFKKYINKMVTPSSYIKKISGKRIIEITNSYLDSIVQLSWRGWWHFDVSNANFWTKNYNFRFLRKINVIMSKFFKKRINIYKKGKMYLSINADSFDELTKDYVSSLISILYPNRKNIVVLDQPFPPGKAVYYSRYFKEDIKSINVLRDPRDIYLLSKCFNKGTSSWIPSDNVEDFIAYFKLIYCSNIESNQNQLTIHFEDLIYDFDNTKKLIDDFLGIESNDSHRFFNPDISINNTQLFTKCPQYKNDIEKIEKELKEYLYDFSKFNKKPTKTNAIF